MAGKKRTDNKGRILRNNELQRQQDGRYMYRYKGLDGKIKTVYALTLSELREKEKVIQRDLDDGIDARQADKMTLNQLFDEYLKIKLDLRPNTRENYLLMWRNNVQDSLGGMKISSIKPLHIEKLYAALSQKGLAKNSIKLIHNLLLPCLQKAVDNDIIRKNPAAGIEFTGTKKKREALTADQQERLLDFVKNSNVYNDRYPFLVIAFGTGCRVGELTGLTWSDVDLKNNVLHINHQLQYLKVDGEKTRFIISPLKTDAGLRDISLNEIVRRALTEQKKLALIQGRRSTANIDGHEGFIFTSKSGQPYATNAINNFLKNIVAAYNKKEQATAEAEHREPELLPHISAHILRHSACTRMAEAGVDLKVTQTTMGHKSAKVTLDVYTHVGDTARIQEEMKKLEKAGGYV